METPVAYPQNLEGLLDVPILLTVEIASGVKSARELLAVRAGSLVEFEKSPQDPVNLYVNNTLVGTGEIVAGEDGMGIRITHILSHGAVDEAAGAPKPFSLN